MQPTGIQIESAAGGTLIRFDTRQPQAVKALLASLDRMGPKGRELSQAEAGLRMALAQRQGAFLAKFMRGQQMRASRNMLRSAIRRLRRARQALTVA